MAEDMTPAELDALFEVEIDETPDHEVVAEEPAFAAREEWLRRAALALKPKFLAAGYPFPEKFRIAVGFGPTGARQESKTVLGVCLHSTCTPDGANEIWISPEDADAASMLATLIHELIHAALDNADGHKGRFKEMAIALGLEGKMTETEMSIELAAELMTLAETLGEYPGTRVDLAGVFSPVPVPVGAGGGTEIPISSGPKKQGTRMIKVTCPEDGYTVRTTEKWLAVGMPHCPAGHEMHRA